MSENVFTSVLEAAILNNQDAVSFQVRAMRRVFEQFHTAVGEVSDIKVWVDPDMALGYNNPILNAGTVLSFFDKGRTEFKAPVVTFRGGADKRPEDIYPLLATPIGCEDAVVIANVQDLEGFLLGLLSDPAVIDIAKRAMARWHRMKLHVGPSSSDTVSLRDHDEYREAMEKHPNLLDAVLVENPEDPDKDRLFSFTPERFGLNDPSTYVTLRQYIEQYSMTIPVVE